MLVTQGLVVAQLVKRRAGTLLTRVQLLSTARIFLPESTFSADSFVQPSEQSHAMTAVRTQRSQALALVWKHEEIIHALLGIGRTAHAAAVTSPS